MSGIRRHSRSGEWLGDKVFTPYEPFPGERTLFKDPEIQRPAPVLVQKKQEVDPRMPRRGTMTWRVLSLIMAYGADPDPHLRSVRNLSETMGLEVDQVMQIVSKLTRRGLLEKCLLPEDARSTRQQRYYFRATCS